MKIQDLDREQIYDLRGITHEQAEELLKWLMINDNNWSKDHLEDLNGENLLYYCIGNGEWIPDYAGNKNKTTHISTLFEEKSYEEQLAEAVKRVEILKEKVKKLKEPEVGDICKFWDDSGFVIGLLEEIDEDGDYWTGGVCYPHTKKLTQQEVIKLLFNK